MLALIFLTFTFVSGEYIFTFPRVLEAASKTSFCLILHDLDLDSFELQQDYTVNVNLTYLPSDDTTGYMPDNYDFKFGAVNMDRTFKKCHEVETPFVVEGNFSVVVNASLTYTEDGSTEVNKLIFGAEKMVTVKRPDLITLVQTDKPIYKPGQTVKFRVMTMDYKLMSRIDGYQQITIETPNGLKVMQWDDIPSPTGLVSLEMPLSSDPVLGSWMIKVLYGSKEIRQSFKVDEYVLPKFEITITPPKYLLPMTKDIRGTVCAKYTYGKPVKGDLIIEVCYKSSYKRNVIGSCAYLIRKINGCYEFFIPAKSIKLGYKEYELWGLLTITVNITEEQTGIKLSSYSESPGMSNIPVTLKIEDDSNYYFKPGFPYNGRVVVTNPDGSPAAGEDILVEAYESEVNGRWYKNFTTDDTGIIHFTITGISSNIVVLFVQANLIENETDWRYKSDGLHHSTYRGQAIIMLTKVFSPSKSYVYVQKVDTIADCDSELNLDVYYTAETGVDYIFTTIVKAGDRIIYAEVKDIKAADNIYNTDILGFDQNLVIQKQERKPTTGQPATRRLQEDCTNKPIVKESIEPEIGSNTREDRERRDTGEKLVGYFKLSIPVTKDMSPNAKILVFYMRDMNKEIVASTIEFKVKSCFNNKVTISFDEVKVKPGANVNLNVGASPSSTCFVGMLDKSVTLLGGNNQLTPGQLFEKVKKVSRRKHHVSYWKEDKAYCDKKTDAKEPELHYTYAVPLVVGAEQSFRDVNLWVETDGNLQSRPCSRRHYIRTPVNDGEIEEKMRRMFEWSPGGVLRDDRIDTASEVSDADTVSTESETIESIDVRTYFPETWLWDIISIGEDGVLNITTTIPDTITEWIGNTVCTHESDGVGVTEMTGVTAFKPFFVSLTLPYSAIRGEMLPIVVTVFNYLSDCITLEVLFKETEGFLFSESSARSRQFCLCGGNSESTKFFIIPTVIGEIVLEIIAVSIDAVSLCRDVVLGEIEIGVTDGVQRQLLIEPEGAPQEQTKSYFLCVQESEIKTEVVELNLPEDVVDSSERATVSVVGDVMGPTLTNLKNLLRMPYGCGEQNMASWSPNIYVLRYLENTEQLTEELENQAEGYMRIGYQRQMKYRHNDNSYSAWGENRYGNATGSLWLTAFVVKSMAQSSAYIVVDKDDILRSARWLVSHQLDNGCFPQVGKVFSSYLKGGLGGHNPAGLTAFTLIALVQADLGIEFEYNINNGFHSCLDSFHPNDIDTYTLSLMLYAYTLIDLEGPRRRNVLDELNRRRINKEGLVHWQRGDKEVAETNDKFYWYRAPSAEVEMTSYILLSMLAQGHDVIGDAQAIVQWLSQQRNPYGGFSSTQV
ncbi:alpha-2-macroglobulin-like [Ruditapes philippinarum]|uniref:alpha-2-macroglobulin-like n=1 Tax=Ruditapes philippinarum TaxID=129788 RepID=UPI00295AB01F|nr:alpha-2-macroglobulin-like [Ruditapes philippinarum]